MLTVAEALKDLDQAHTWLAKALRVLEHPNGPTLTVDQAASLRWRVEIVETLTARLRTGIVRKTQVPELRLPRQHQERTG